MSYSTFKLSAIIAIVVAIVSIPVAIFVLFPEQPSTITADFVDVNKENKDSLLDVASANTDRINDGSRNEIQWPNIHENVLTDFQSKKVFPEIENDSFIHPFAVVIGDCHIDKTVFVAPTAVCRGDEGVPIYIGAHSNIQDGVVLHALETSEDGKNIDNRKYSITGERLHANDPSFDKGYAVYVGSKVSVAHGALVHGPAWIGNNTFVGMESMVFNAKVGNNVAVGVSSTITGGVEIPDDKFVPPGSVITTQEQADALPSRIGSPYEEINKGVIHVNEELDKSYSKEGLKEIVKQREADMEEDMLETGMPANK